MTKSPGHINEGRTSIKQVGDRKLPTKLDPETVRSAEIGGKDIGHNPKSFREDQEEFGRGVDTTGTVKAHIFASLALVLAADSI